MFTVLICYFSIQKSTSCRIVTSNLICYQNIIRLVRISYLNLKIHENFRREIPLLIFHKIQTYYFQIIEL